MARMAVLAIRRLANARRVFTGIAPAYGSVTLVMVVICVNTAALALDRSLTRATEISIRISLGASKMQLFRESLITYGVLVLSAAAVGTVVAIVLSPVLSGLLLEVRDLHQLANPNIREVHVGTSGIFASLGVSFGSLVLFAGLACARLDDLSKRQLHGPYDRTTFRRLRTVTQQLARCSSCGLLQPCHHAWFRHKRPDFTSRSAFVE